MAQHDMNIANQGFPATRADLNNALQALVSNSSGATEPSTTFANQWWYDTTNNKMYIRNEANNAWIEVAVLDQTNNEWQITTGVVQAKDSDGLALKTDDGTTRLFIKDSDGSIGIGTTSPSANLHVSSGTSGDAVVLIEADTDNNDEDDTPILRLSQDGGATITDIGIEGTAATLFTNSLSNATYINTTGSTPIQFATNDTARMTITNTGQIGINETSPDKQLHVNGGTDNIVAKFESTDTACSVEFTDSTGTVTLETRNDFRFKTDTDIDMMIDSNGNVLIGKASGVSDSYLQIAGSSSVSSMRLENSYASGTAILINNQSNASFNALYFENGGTNRGSIVVGTSSTAYNTTSDYRLKENIVDLTGAIDRLQQLQVKRFNFIGDSDMPTVDGFLAHEAQAVVPEAVHGTQDGMRDEEYEVSAATGDIYTPAVDAVVDEEGNEVSAAVDEVIHSSNVEKPETLEEGQLWRETTAAVMGTRSVPDYQGIDQSKLVPLLTAALQEAIAKIEALETRVAALEGA